jgi:hypothetical protein
MGTAKLYFEDGIPEKTVIEKWTVDIGCFHTPEVVIKKSKDNKTLFIGFDDAYPEICFGWQKFFNTSKAKWISFYAEDDMGEGDNYYIFHSDGQTFFSITASNTKFLKKSMLEAYRFLSNLGFSKEYLRFNFSKGKEEDKEMLLDFRVPESYYDDILKGDEPDELE